MESKSVYLCLTSSYVTLKSVSIRLMCGFVALDTSCCSLTGLSDWCWLLSPWKPATVVSLVYQIDVGVLWSAKPAAVVCGFGCQLLWCYWCITIRLMLGFYGFGQ